MLRAVPNEVVVPPTTGTMNGPIQYFVGVTTEYVEARMFSSYATSSGGRSPFGPPTGTSRYSTGHAVATIVMLDASVSATAPSAV